MKLILVGPPGAGKGTHAVDLSKMFHVPHISTGDILRDAIKRGTPTGLKARAFMEKGELVPDSVVVGIVAERLKDKDCQVGFVLDGFPRNLSQARDLDKTLEAARSKVDAVVYLKADLDVILRRLTSRRVCKNCNAGYNVLTLPPKKEGICDVCGGPLIQRPDDREQTIRNRLEVYEHQTAELISYYQSQGVLRTVNGNLQREEGFRGIVAALRDVKGT